MGSDRSLTAGEETGWSDALTAANREIVELTRCQDISVEKKTNFCRSHYREK